MVKIKTQTKRTAKKKKKQPKSFKNWIVRLVVKLFLLLVAVLVLFLGIVYWGVFGPIPTQRELLQIKNSQASEVYSKDGVLLGKYYIQDRSAVSYQNISPHAIDALVATEDARFFDHSGIDYRSLLRVLVKTVILQKKSGGGGSTITQQLAKNIYGRLDYDYLSVPINKVKEIFTAIRLEQVYSKEDIITLYFNTVPFGDNAFGIESASQRFFSTSARHLTVPQAATIIGMLKANYSYNPRLFPEKSKKRRNIVLSQMNKYGYLTKKDLHTYRETPLKLNYQSLFHSKGVAAYFREQVRQKAMKWCAANTKEDGTPYNLYTDGLRIYTTLHSRMQQYAEQAMRKQMKSLQTVFGKHIKGKEPWKKYPSMIDRAIRQSQRYRQLKNAGVKEGDIIKVFDKKVPMEIFTWEGKKKTTMTPRDSIKHYLGFLQAGFVAVDSHTGAVRSWVGGIDFGSFQYDHVQSSTKRQVGSIFKPIVYATAMDAGIPPCEYISAEKVVYDNYDNWTPENGEDNYHLKYSMLGALSKSVNTVAVNLLDQTGIRKVINTAKKLGIESTLPEVPSLALGVANISMLEMAQAYTTFSNSGTPVSPYAIDRIESASGDVLYQGVQKQTQRAISKETTQLMVEMMKSVVNKGTGSRIRWKYKLTNDLAGKTGTTQNNTDGWFAATLPDLVMLSWVGADNPAFRFRSTALGQGANTALPITAFFLQSMNGDPALKKIARAQFASPSHTVADLLDCLLEKEDTNFIEKIFGKRKKEIKRSFGDTTKTKKKKKGLFNKLKNLFKKKN